MKRVLNELFDENFIAVLAAEDDKIIYENPAARDRFAHSFIDEPADSVFRVTESLMSSASDGDSCEFEAEILGEYHPVRAVCIDGITVYRIGRADAAAGSSAKILMALDSNLRSSLSVAMLGLHNVSSSLGSKSDPSEKTGLHALCQSCYRMLRTAGDLGLLAALRTGQDSLKLENLEIFPLLSEYVEKSSALLEDIGVRVSLKAEQTHTISAIDRERFERLYYCLIAECLSHEALSVINVHFCVSQNEIMLTISDDGRTAELPEDPFSLEYFDEITGKMSFELPLAEAIASRFGGRIMLSGGSAGNVRTVILPCRVLDSNMLHGTKSEYSGGMDIALIELAPFISSRHYEI